MDRAHLVFLKVAQTGNLTAAARELHIAQPSLTRTIGKLEEDFGVPLFNRLPRGMELTAAGRALRTHLAEMHAIYMRARKDVEAVRRGYLETIRIGAGLTYQMLFVPELLRRMWQRFPRTSFHVSTGAAETHVRAVIDGELDIAVTAAVPEFRHPSLETRIVGSIKHGVAHWPGTLPEMPEDEPTPLELLQGHDWVLLRGPEMQENLGALFFRHGLPTPRVALTTTSVQLGLDTVRDQGLVMSLPMLLAPRLRAQGYRLHATDEPLWQIESGIALHRANRDQDVLVALIEELEALTTSAPGFARPAAPAEAISQPR